MHLGLTYLRESSCVHSLLHWLYHHESDRPQKIPKISYLVRIEAREKGDHDHDGVDEANFSWTLWFANRW